MSGLSSGAHSFAVKQTDGGGDASAAATVSWNVDLNAPEAPVLSGRPAARTNSISASISFSGESGASFTCSVDGGAYSACTSPKSLTLLSEGAHSLAVKQTDLAENLSEASTASWVVDRTVPLAPVLTRRPASPSNSSAFAFTGESG
ncbi:MAG: hypothetical protein WCH97_06060, partial [Actinomycetes bacterium]